MLDVMYLHTGMNNECYAYFATYDPVAVMMERGACNEKVSVDQQNSRSIIAPEYLIRLTQYQWTTNDSGRATNDKWDSFTSVPQTLKIAAQVS